MEHAEWCSTLIYYKIQCVVSTDISGIMLVSISDIERIIINFTCIGSGNECIWHVRCLLTNKEKEPRFVDMEPERNDIFIGLLMQMIKYFKWSEISYTSFLLER